MKQETQHTHKKNNNNKNVVRFVVYCALRRREIVFFMRTSAALLSLSCCRFVFRLFSEKKKFHLLCVSVQRLIADRSIFETKNKNFWIFSSFHLVPFLFSVILFSIYWIQTNFCIFDMPNSYAGDCRSSLEISFIFFFWQTALHCSMRWALFPVFLFSRFFFSQYWLLLLSVF